MWKQLTQRARKAIFLAQEEAGRLGYSHVGPEHLLLALLREDDCVAARILERLGLDLGTVRVELMDCLSKGTESLADDMQLSADAKAAIDLAFEEARALNEGWVGTEHLLLGLARGTNSVAGQVLSRLGADVGPVREQLRNIHAGALPFDGTNGGGPAFSAV